MATATQFGARSVCGAFDAAFAKVLCPLVLFILNDVSLVFAFTKTTGHSNLTQL